MMALPDTRVTLLQRLGDRNDAGAWVEFCTIYERTIYSIARKYGLQDADARDISQEVLLAISRKIGRFDPAADGKFRSWLATIARNMTVDQLRRNKSLAARQQAFHQSQLREAELRQEQSGLFDLTARREQFRWAAEQTRGAVAQSSWSAFWLTAVEGKSAAEVSQQLGLSVGAVYVARCRVLAKIKGLIEPFRES